MITPRILTPQEQNVCRNFKWLSSLSISYQFPWYMDPQSSSCCYAGRRTFYFDAMSVFLHQFPKIALININNYLQVTKSNYQLILKFSSYFTCQQHLKNWASLFWGKTKTINKINNKLTYRTLCSFTNSFCFCLSYHFPKVWVLEILTDHSLFLSFV